MAESCQDMVLSLGFPKTLSNLGVGVIGSSYPDRCLIRSGHPCFAGSQDLYLDIGQTKTVTCDDSLSMYWEVTYTEYMSEYAVRVQVCQITEDEEPPEPTPPPVGEVDYDRIEAETASIVEDAESVIKAEISEVTGAVSGVAALLNTVHNAINTRIEGLTDHIDGVVGDLGQGLHTWISEGFNTLSGGLEGLGEKIDGLKFPTLDSIKQGFLDTCADLAIALWDAILDRIEERYPDDKEESD